MLHIEKNYDFLNRFREIHKADRRLSFRPAGENEVMLDDSWSIFLAEKSSGAEQRAADDLQDYLFVSMGVSLKKGQESPSPVHPVYQHRIPCQKRSLRN